MGLYMQLIVAFASILARAEMFASKKATIATSIDDGIGTVWVPSFLYSCHQLLRGASREGRPLGDRSHQCKTPAHNDASCPAGFRRRHPDGIFQLDRHPVLQEKRDGRPLMREEG
ncbi:MAG: hypothetical protein MZV70_02315 [Desulfobacterales bacterium]|nr:hypothetical protein [Desulfobacterales bacterium]